MSSALASLRDALVVRAGYPLLSGVTLDVEPATVTVLSGANGSGKTTLLQLLGGLVALSAGAGEVCGIDLARDERRALRRRVGWLGHEGSFYDELSVRENLVFAARALGRPIEEIPAALERVDLASRADVAAKLLSAGQRRRLGLAWLLVRRPELWLLDEPHAALDAAARAFLDELVGDVVRAGATVVLSAHDAIAVARHDVRHVRLVGGRVGELA